MILDLEEEGRQLWEELEKARERDTGSIDTYNAHSVWEGRWRGWLFKNGLAILDRLKRLRISADAWSDVCVEVEDKNEKLKAELKALREFARFAKDDFDPRTDHYATDLSKMATEALGEEWE